MTQKQISEMVTSNESLEMENAKLYRECLNLQDGAKACNTIMLFELAVIIALGFAVIL